MSKNGHCTAIQFCSQCLPPHKVQDIPIHLAKRSSSATLQSSIHICSEETSALACQPLQGTPCLCAKSLQQRLTLRSYGRQPTRLLCPCDSPGKNTGVGSCAHLQEIFRTQGWNSYVSCHWKVGSLPLVLPGKPKKSVKVLITQSCLTLCSPVDKQPIEKSVWGCKS